MPIKNSITYLVYIVTFQLAARAIKVMVNIFGCLPSCIIMNLYYFNLILVFVFRTFLLQFFQFALLTVVKLEVLWALDSNSRVGKRVLVNKTFPAIFPLPQAQEAVAAHSCWLPFAVPLHTLPQALLCSRATTAARGRTPSVILAQVVPSDQGHVRNPAGSAQLHSWNCFS